MQPTVKSMRQGSTLLLGKYSVDKDAEPVSIAWTKATPNGDFISSDAVDFLCFDAREIITTEGRATNGRNGGNPEYGISNIRQFLNSDEDDWYHPAHDGDRAPTGRYTDVNAHIGTYTDHYGFLRHFEDFELACILPQTYTVDDAEITSLIRLPRMCDIVGDSRFNIFKKKGIRAHPTEDLVLRKRGAGYNSTGQFIPYFLADRSQRFRGQVGTIDRSGYINYTQPASVMGIRPVCKLKLDAKVEETERGVYELTPCDVAPIEVVSNEELLIFLGLVQT